MDCKNAAFLWSLLPTSARLIAQYDSDDEVVNYDTRNFQSYTYITDMQEAKSVVDFWIDAIERAVPGVRIDNVKDSTDMYMFEVAL